MKAARSYVQSGKRVVVGVDLAKLFDRVNHDILIARLSGRIDDAGVIRLIRAYLNAGIMDGGLVIERHLGTPQGGPLNPLLANVLLDDVDKALEARGYFRPGANAWGLASAGRVVAPPTAGDPAHTVETAEDDLLGTQDAGRIRSSCQQVAGNSHRWWRNSGLLLNSVLTIAYFDRLGVPRLSLLNSWVWTRGWIAARNGSGLVDCHRRCGRRKLIERWCVDAQQGDGALRNSRPLPRGSAAIRKRCLHRTCGEVPLLIALA